MRTLAAALAIVLAVYQSANIASAAERFGGGFVGGYRGPRVGVYLGAPFYDPFWPMFPYYSYPYYYPPYPYPAPGYPEVAQSPTAPATAPAPAWYYCDDPQGYYPYVRSCNHAWQSVPAEPAQAEATPP
jgi:hypothetical protein